MIIALAGGVGGAKLTRGLAKILSPKELLVVVNTGDDFSHLGYPICPDIDTNIYNLAGIHNPITGWGIRNDTYKWMETFAASKEDSWFSLGDRDIETHSLRKAILKNGGTLSDATDALCKKYGIEHRIVPMSNDPMPTLIHTDQGPLSFQDYFVKEKTVPKIHTIESLNQQKAKIHPEILEALASPALSAIIICPSNPLVSIGPILRIPGMKERLIASKAPIFAVSPLIGGKAIKGPTVKMLQELGLDPSIFGLCDFYKDLLNGIIIDKIDSQHSQSLKKRGLSVHMLDTMMDNPEKSVKLASEIMAWITQSSSL